MFGAHQRQRLGQYKFEVARRAAGSAEFERPSPPLLRHRLLYESFIDCARQRFGIAAEHHLSETPVVQDFGPAAAPRVPVEESNPDRCSTRA